MCLEMGLDGRLGTSPAWHAVRDPAAASGMNTAPPATTHVCHVYMPFKHAKRDVLTEMPHLYCTILSDRSFENCLLCLK